MLSKGASTQTRLDKGHSWRPKGEIQQQRTLVEDSAMVDENGPHYFVAFQTPGPRWVQGLKYNEQPDFMVHVGYMTELQDKGLTVLSGPFMEKPGGRNGVLADGGMTIFRALPERC
jgi:hypothetical protein